MRRNRLFIFPPRLVLWIAGAAALGLNIGACVRTDAARQPEGRNIAMLESGGESAADRAGNPEGSTGHMESPIAEPPIRMAERPGFRMTFMLTRGLETNMILVDLPETITSNNEKLIFSPVMGLPPSEDRRLDQGVWHYRARTPVAEVVARWSYEDSLASMTLTITNTSDRTYEDLRAAVCLQAAGAQSFRDTTRERVWVFAEGRKISWAEIDRRDGFRSHLCLVKDAPQPPGRAPGSGDPGFILSQVSNVLVDDAVIVMSSPTGHWSLGTVWQGATAVFNNNMPSLCCIHSDPFFGNVAPGETVTRQGWIHATPQGPEEAHTRLKQLLSENPAD